MYRLPPDLEPGLESTSFYDPVLGSFRDHARTLSGQVVGLPRDPGVDNDVPGSTCLPTDVIGGRPRDARAEALLLQLPAIGPVEMLGVLTPEPWVS